jgi:hypothetical protein
MIYVALAIAFVALLVYAFFAYRKRSLLARMSRGIDMVKLGSYWRLCLRFQRDYGDETASYLAAAVTNHLFCEEPSNPQAAGFLESHGDLVEREVLNLRNDLEARELITQAVRVKCTLSYARGSRDAALLMAPVDRLIECGIPIPGGEPPSPDSFLPAAERFFSDSKQLWESGLQRRQT